MKRMKNNQQKSNVKGNQRHNNKKASTYTSVVSKKDGRKVIDLKKLNNDVSQNERKRDLKFNTKKPQSEPEKPKNSKNQPSNLDLPLDSVIQKRKEKDFSGHHKGGHKRKHYEVSEEYYPGYNEDSNPTYHGKNKQFDVDEVEYESRSPEDGSAEETSNFKKNKNKNKMHKQNAMNYLEQQNAMNYGFGMYGYPQAFMAPQMYGMDPYAMSTGYFSGAKSKYFKPQKFKNKSMVFNKDNKTKN